MNTIEEVREEKIKTYYKDIKMKESSKESAMIELVVSEIVEIKMHLCNGREFEAGVGLGSLINSLLNRKDILEEDEEVQDENEDEECEESKDKEDFETMYYAKCEEFIEQKENLIDFREENKLIRDCLTKCKYYLKLILKKDHIFKDSVPECLLLFKELGYSDEEIRYMLPGTQIGPFNDLLLNTKRS